METDALAFLQVLQLADSALPVGTVAHSFGLETLAAEQWLRVEELERFLHTYLEEAGSLECCFCLLGHGVGSRVTAETLTSELEQWRDLNAQLSAYKTARESREASATLGRRLLQLAQGLQVHPLLPAFLQVTRAGKWATHQSLAFGLLGGLLQMNATQVALAQLQQTLSGLISACQRLLPLGQSRASQILWHLHPAVLTAVERSKEAVQENDISCFTPLVDLGSMRHPTLTTRLFIS